MLQLPRCCILDTQIRGTTNTDRRAVGDGGVRGDGKILDPREKGDECCEQHLGKREVEQHREDFNVEMVPDDICRGSGVAAYPL